jgi:hypothetical protein
MAIAVLLLLVLVLSVGLGFSVAQLLSQKARLEQFATIPDFEKHKERILEAMRAAEERTAQLKVAATKSEQRIAALSQQVAPLERALDIRRTIDQLTATAADQEKKLASLRVELESVEESRNIQSFGLYRPRFALGTSAEYQKKIDEVYARQKELVKSDQAAHCPTNWTVDGSVAKGKKMIAEQSKLMLRAFNGECDAAIAKIKFNNAEVLQTRLKKSFEAINKLGSGNSISITQEYLATKIDELHLAHELQEKQHAEREEQRAIKEQIREEERAQREIEDAQAKAERETAQREEALERARKELLESSGRHTQKLEQLVSKLELELKDAIDRKAKAIARAQLTKSGHVYVISNIGSFGEQCFKIGMTRRLDPMERVWELGAASVPFDFDVHAMIFSENAPELETALHRHFAARRVNKVNARKEFFRIGLDEIQQAVESLHGVVTFVSVPEAEDYRKTIAMEQSGDAANELETVGAPAPSTAAQPA